MSQRYRLVRQRSVLTWPAAPVPDTAAPATPSAATAPTAPGFSREDLQELLWDEAGLVRDETGLGHAASVIAHWREQHRTPVTERDLEDENLLLVAEHLVAAARARRASVGAHFRSDDPTTAPPRNPQHSADADAPVAAAAPRQRSHVDPTPAKESVAC